MKEDICYHRAVHRSTTGSLPQNSYYMLMLPHGMCTYYTCRNSTTSLLPQDSATRLLPLNGTTCCYHMRLQHPQYYIGEYTT